MSDALAARGRRDRIAVERGGGIVARVAVRLVRRGEHGSIHTQAGCQLWRGVADAVQELAQQFDELDDVVVQLDVPLAVRGVGVLS
jgi:hypothetical protein